MISSVQFALAALPVLAFAQSESASVIVPITLNGYITSIVLPTFPGTAAPSAPLTVIPAPLVVSGVLSSAASVIDSLESAAYNYFSTAASGMQFLPLELQADKLT